MKRLYTKWFAASVATLAITSCTPGGEPIDENPDLTPEGYAQGVWISNEGGFLASNSSVSWMLLDSSKSENNIFLGANARPLGDIAQSTAKVGADKMAIVVNNSQKVEVVNAKDATSVYTITNLTYPRYAISDDAFLYVSNGSFAGQIMVYDAETGAFQDSIAVGNGPERMGISNGKLFVANSGGFTTDSTVSVIDLSSRTVIETIQVGDLPTDVAVDAAGDVWVMCRGKAIYDSETFEEIDATEPKLVKISGISNQVVLTLPIGEKFDHPREVEVNEVANGIFFNLNGEVYQGLLNGNILTAMKVVPVNGLNGLGVSPQGDIYVTENSDYTNPSDVRVYDLAGTLKFEFEAGIAPNGFVFF